MVGFQDTARESKSAPKLKVMIDLDAKQGFHFLLDCGRPGLTLNAVWYALRIMNGLRNRTVWAAVLAVCSAPAIVARPVVGSDAQSSATTRYFLVFLRPDPARKTLTTEETERIQTAHMANIHKMADNGVLRSAGPFDDTQRTISGIFIFKVESVERAKAIAANDPTVVEHRNTVDVHAWEGPSGIGEEYFRLHRLDPTTPENMQAHPFCMLLRGEQWDSKRDREELLVAHEKYIGELRAAGKLGAGGRIEAPDELVGLVIFRPVQLEEAQQLMGEDPAVKAGILRVEYHRWWSSGHVLPW